MLRFALAAALLLATTPAAAQITAREGILLLAHGGAADWNQRVNALAAAIDASQPVEVAFGMASRPSIQAAIDKLIARGATSIVAVPLFISSHSSVVTSTEYLLGLRKDMPADLRVFAKMNHGAHGGHNAHAPAPAPDAAHAHHSTADAPVVDNTTPVTASVPIRMTSALNRHSLVGEILIDRARAISRSAASEAVIVVAHGPVPDDDNHKWLADMKVLSEQIDGSTSFAAIKYLTVRDDAPKPIRDAAAAELRQLVQEQTAQGRRVLIVPLLLSYGGIEKGIRQRLEGLDYVMAESALMPDDRLQQWVRESVK
jgi:sirohydrochlorin ferrochelatase